MAEIPHLAWPLRVAGGTFITVEQGTIEDVRQCVHVLLCTPLGARPLSPDVGVPDPTFTRGIDADGLASLLTDDENGEPRADVRVATSQLGSRGELNVQVTVALADDAEDDPGDQETVEL